MARSADKPPRGSTAAARAYWRLRGWIGGRLERGLVPTSLTAAASRAWGTAAAARLRRARPLPTRVPVVALYGATLGGAGKTPLAATLARSLAEDHGRHPALLSHGYGGSLDGPGRVAPEDARASDDGRLLATMAPRIKVLEGPDRDAACSEASSDCDVIVADSCARVGDASASARVLVLDAREPFGSRACPPVGDLRAPPDALLDAADAVAVIGADTKVRERARVELEQAGLSDRTPVFEIEASTVLLPSCRGAERGPGGFDALAGQRVGLATAIAHPERVLRALRRLGIEPEAAVHAADHAAGSGSGRDALVAAMAREEVDVWLTTSRCALGLPDRIGQVDVLSLDLSLDVTGLSAWIARRLDGSVGAS